MSSGSKSKGKNKKEASSKLGQREPIEDFDDLHLKWFIEKGLLKNGLLVHDTIARVVSRVDIKEFQRCFIDWMNYVTNLSDGKLIAIDGKRLCS